MPKKSTFPTPVIEIRDDLSRDMPREIVSLLDQYIIGQQKAKRLVAIALRNRIRRKFVAEAMRDEISPKNILMIGPTGVGKTEIARRIAMTLDAPFIKVEATRFTERGYVGRDVESMIRTLVNTSVNTIKSRMRKQLKTDVDKEVEEYLVDMLMSDGAPSRKRGAKVNRKIAETAVHKVERKKQIRADLIAGKMENQAVNIQVRKRVSPMLPMADLFPGIEDMDNGMASIMGDMNMETEDNRRMSVSDAREVLTQQLLEERIDKDRAAEIGVKWAQEMGIVFIDEIDKIADKSSGNGPDVSREGVQRDLLPIVEGTTVNTRYGIVKTDHILFIAAGAFHVSKPSDMIPELQGRFPIRVELTPLSQEDLGRILVEPKNSLLRQYEALLATEGVVVEMTPDAIEAVVAVAYEINSSVEDIGARRLHTVMEYLFEDLSFQAPEMKGEKVVIDRDMVLDKLSILRKDRDLTRYIL
jgi:ATP-dependent HslUV protease ATP-binding subunit HslU